LDAVGYQILTGVSSDRLKNFAYPSKTALYNCNSIIPTPRVVNKSATAFFVLPLFEIAIVLVRFDHVANVIVKRESRDHAQRRS